MILFPEWPSPAEMAKLSWRGRLPWGILVALQFVGCLLGAACIIF